MSDDDYNSDNSNNSISDDSETESVIGDVKKTPLFKPKNDDSDSDEDTDDDKPDDDKLDENNDSDDYDEKNQSESDEELDEDEDDDDDDDNYLQKFDNDIIKNYVNDFHPECLNHNYDEISKLTIVVRNKE